MALRYRLHTFVFVCRNGMHLSRNILCDDHVIRIIVILFAGVDGRPRVL